MTRGSMTCLELRVVGPSPQQEIAVAQDRRQEVVEVVGDAAGQPADGLELVRLAELLLELFAQRHVAEAPDPPDGPALHPLRAREALEQPAVLEIQEVEAFGLRGRVELADLREELLGIPELVEHEGDRPLVVARSQNLGRDAPHDRELAVRGYDPAVPVDDEDPVGGRFERRPQQRNYGLQGLQLARVVGNGAEHGGLSRSPRRGRPARRERRELSAPTCRR